MNNDNIEIYATIKTKDMKTAEEILNEVLVDVEDRPAFFREQDVADLIGQAQKDAYNQAIEDVAKYSIDRNSDGVVIHDGIDSESILKLKK